jgi:hypothetical protein
MAHAGLPNGVDVVDTGQTPDAVPKMREAIMNCMPAHKVWATQEEYYPGDRRLSKILDEAKATLKKEEIQLGMSL